MRLLLAKRVIERALARPWAGRLAGALLRDRIPWRGLTIDTSDPAVAPEVKARLLLRMYESAEARFVDRFLSGDLDVVELGGSIGAVGSLAASRLQPGRRLVSVEADPRLLPALRRNLEAHAPGRAVALHGALAWPPAGEVVLQAGDSSLVGRVSSSGAGLRVPGITLSQLLARERLGDFALLCDVEGAEAGLLFHDHAALARCRRVVIELHRTEDEGRPLGPEELLAQLQALGFELLDRYGSVCALARR